jgi:peptidyl-prolyl cis-trans isomerase A (cyclophilin A)
VQPQTLAAVSTQSPPSTLAFALLAACAAACNASPPEPSKDKSPNVARTSDTGGKKVAPDDQQQQTQQRPTPPKPPKRKINAKPTATVPASPGDPLAGKWSLDDAEKGLPPGKQISATIETSLGSLECKLFDDKAPITVANFVGLARGLRPWKTPEDKWEKKPAYDGTIFHRIIKGFMIQGGDARKNGTGEPGYVIPDEIWEDANHDRPGLLCMANRGKNTNGAQFFITDDAANHLDDGYTIFGECGPVELVHKIASVDVRGEKPATQVDIKKITITRK